MNNIIDLSKLPISPNADAKALIAINTNGDVIVANNELQKGVVTEDELNYTLKNYAKKSDIPTDYVTQTQLNNKGYLTSIPSEYINETELNNTLVDYAKKSDIPTDVYDSVTEAELQDALKNYQPKGNYLTSVPSEYVTETELNDKGYITSIPTDVVRVNELNASLSAYQPKGDYVTDAQLNNKGYLTSIPSEYINETELNNALVDYAKKSDIPSNVPTDVVTESELNDALKNYQPKGNYLTSIPSEYVTETELNGKGYLTSVPSEYVNETELNSALTSYAKKSDVPSIESMTQSQYDALTSKDSNTLYIIID